MKAETIDTAQNTKAEMKNFVSMEQPLFSLYQAWIVKGCVQSWDSFRRYRYIQPKGGLFDDTYGGRGVFKNETIREWLPLTDKDMAEYNRKHRTGAKPRGFAKKGAA